MGALGKEFTKIKILKKSLPRAQRWALGTTSFFRRRPASALGKIFAECPTNGPRQRPLCRREIFRRLFAEGSPRQRLCRGFYSLCRRPEALGKILSAVVSVDRWHASIIVGDRGFVQLTLGYLHP